MIKKEIRFEDFDGHMVVETHYFHLSKAELIDLELSTAGGMAAKYQTILSSNQPNEIIRAFKDIIMASYGQREEGSGTVFRKSPKISEAFMASPAFDAFFDELLTSEETASEFVNGLLPKDLVKTVAKEQNSSATAGTSKPVPGASTGATYHEENELSGLKSPRDEDDKLLPWAFRDPTDTELTKMSHPQLQDVFKRRSTGWEAPVGRS
ncbi:MAG TPA: hypothetical protein VGI71_24035 [Scandinavium sp.]|jgi:hypothetical protein